MPSLGELGPQDIPTCGLADRVGDVYQRVHAAGWDRCVVVNDRRIVLGLLRGKAWKAEPRSTAEEAMLSGPSTFRPSVPLDEMLQYMQEHELDGALVTTSDETLMGFLPRREAEEAFHRLHIQRDKVSR